MLEPTLWVSAYVSFITLVQTSTTRTCLACIMLLNFEELYSILFAFSFQALKEHSMPCLEHHSDSLGFQLPVLFYTHFCCLKFRHHDKVIPCGQEMSALVSHFFFQVKHALSDLDCLSLVFFLFAVSPCIRPLALSDSKLSSWINKLVTKVAHLFPIRKDSLLLGAYVASHLRTPGSIDTGFSYTLLLWGASLHLHGVGITKKYSPNVLFCILQSI